ncbi:VPLPA-CTERM sorting domain-containing protein [Roseovarius aestuariivivens]|uniref:VPLPA-CTERM sorting domain-containing protein n=1 Tax=Roseovarius aestuariivivens TaxID=1888910 RepID=UPI001FD8A75E|nr:VPLPA-CTERM sorting domain-containing protein [Roseovarius aestuariivivens]
MFRTVRLALLATCLVVAGGAAQAATYLFSFDSTFTNGSAAAGISGNDAFSLQVLVDNGGNTDLNQQWFQADVLSATLTSGSYTATFNAPYLNDLTFVTDGAGQITQSNWYDVDSNNTDTLGPGSPKAFANLLRLSNGEGLSYARLISDTQGWTVSAVSQIPLPAGGLLLLGGLGALAALRRRKV